MKKNKFWNIFPKNPTQTAYFRFLKKPDGEIKTGFSESKKRFGSYSKDGLKTEFDDLLRGLK